MGRKELVADLKRTRRQGKIEALHEQTRAEITRLSEKYSLESSDGHFLYNSEDLGAYGLVLIEEGSIEEAIKSLPKLMRKYGVTNILFLLEVTHDEGRDACASDIEGWVLWKDVKLEIKATYAGWEHIGMEYLLGTAFDAVDKARFEILLGRLAQNLKKGHNHFKINFVNLDTMKK